MEETDEPIQNSRRRGLPHWGRGVWIGFAAAAIAVAGITAAVTYQSGTTSPIPLDVAEKALFDTYYPSRLPQGFELDEDSYGVQEGALIFSASHQDGRKLAFTETAVPKDFDFDEFNQGLSNSKRLSGTPHTAIIGRMPGQRTVLSITAGNAWLLMTSQNDVPEGDLRLIASHLRK
jgi:hypothetical protein